MDWAKAFLHVYKYILFILPSLWSFLLPIHRHVSSLRCRCAPPPTPPALPHSRGHISGHVAARAKLNSREQVLTLFPVRQEGSNSAQGLNITARALIMFNTDPQAPIGRMDG